jgi:hypothetical protein
MSHLQQRESSLVTRPRHHWLNSVCMSALSALSLLAAAGQSFADTPRRLDVLELFTSQGCSSCPPADALLGTLSKEKGVLALTMPVNYWDYLGWRDTLAKEAYTQRQQAYAAARGDRQIYTPQLIVNGMDDVVGSQASAIEAARKSTSQSLAASSVPVSISQSGGKVHVEAGSAPDGSVHRSGKIWLVYFSSSVSVDIGRGENSGRQVIYTNVVRALASAGAWSGAQTRLDVEIPSETSFDGIAVLLHADDSQAVLGAATMSLPSQ